MTAALSADQRSDLEKLVQRARRWIEEDLEAKLAGSFGINSDGRIEDIAGLSLSNAQASVRDDLVEIIMFLRSEGEDDEGSVARLVREAAFTHTNRLIAVRVAEAIGLLPETIAKGTASSGFRDFSELAPTVATTEWGRFAEFLRLCADELAADVPALFDPRNPLLELTMSEVVLARVIEAISILGNELWAAPDTLGWAYQFFNTGEERREMRESSAPRNSRELAVRNQFFTPSYVVEFLVHNGLGAHLAAGFPDLADELPLLVEAPTEQVEVDLAAVSVLDPACGSGHFLLGAYDVLERAWQHAGVEPAKAAPAIVRSLWGIDIDPRAAQIAQAAVMFRARRHCRDEKLAAANVICARSLPSGPEIDAFIASLPEHVGRAVKGIAEELVDAPILGPLLKIEERLDREVRDVFGTGVFEGTLAESVVDESVNVEAAVLDALSAIADSTTSTASQRLFAAEAHDAVRFVEAMSRRYTAVLMNPPFGEPVKETRPYLKAAYPWIPTKDHNLFAAFVGRGLELCIHAGSVSAVTSRVGMFLKTFEAWRSHVFFDNHVTALADLGYGVMEQALVEAAAYTVRAERGGTQVSTFLRLLKDADKSTALASLIQSLRHDGVDPSRVFRVSSSDLRATQGSTIAYWLSESLMQMYVSEPTLGQSAGDVRVGLQTGDDDRFLRTSWEVDPGAIARTRHESETKRWVFHAKGGSYSPFWSDLHLVVRWANDGEEIRASISPSGEEFYFKSGVTWPRRTASGFGPRVLPPGAIIGNKGPAVFPHGDSYVVLAWLSSRVVSGLVAAGLAAGDEVTSGGAAKSYEVGLVRGLPWPRGLDEAGPDVSHLIRSVTLRARRRDFSEETTRLFHAPEVVRRLVEGMDLLDAAEATLRAREDDALAMMGEHLAVEHRLAAACGLGASDLDYLDHEVGPHPASYGEVDSPPAQFTELYRTPIGALIDRLVEEQGGARHIVNQVYVADRQLEVLSHGMSINPRSIVRFRRQLGLLPVDWVERAASDVLSYLVGVAFGRWDPGCAMATLPLDIEIEDPLPVFPPGGVGAEGIDPSSAAALGARPSLLVDQQGSENDLESRVRVALGVLVDDAEDILMQLLQYVDGRTLRGYFRAHFFKSHLSRYSMSRRKAPIYWQLQVPSKSWGLWLYAPTLSREMLFAIVSATEQRQRLAEQQIAHLQREAETGSGGRKASEVAKELEVEQRLAVELASFRAEAERIANLGWEPDLDDGMVLNAAPLADLFPAWKDAAAYRKELRAGKYEWATVARYADQL